MKGYITNIEELTRENEDFRRVLYTSHNGQLVLMALPRGVEIGEEIHEENDQFFRIEEGEGKVIINDEPHAISDGSVVIVPKGAKHNVINTGAGPLKLYSLYMPPHHRDGTVHHTKAAAEDDDEHFDGVISE
ncbi:MAG TPA: cupin domain-containing protein [Candidatus Paceibacterota bacterium]|nr:cupin domain-containing protein [Candidatus Paceibacterota bacterium]